MTVLFLINKNILITLIKIIFIIKIILAKKKSEKIVQKSLDDIRSYMYKKNLFYMKEMLK